MELQKNMSKCKNHPIISDKDREYIKDLDPNEFKTRCYNCKEVILLVKDSDVKNEYFVIDLGQNKKLR